MGMWLTLMLPPKDSDMEVWSGSVIEESRHGLGLVLTLIQYGPSQVTCEKASLACVHTERGRKQKNQTARKRAVAIEFEIRSDRCGCWCER